MYRIDIHLLQELFMDSCVVQGLKVSVVVSVGRKIKVHSMFVLKTPHLPMLLLLQWRMIAKGALFVKVEVAF